MAFAIRASVTTFLPPSSHPSQRERYPSSASATSSRKTNNVGISPEHAIRTLLQLLMRSLLYCSKEKSRQDNVPDPDSPKGSAICFRSAVYLETVSAQDTQCNADRRPKESCAEYPYLQLSIAINSYISPAKKDSSPKKLRPPAASSIRQGNLNPLNLSKTPQGEILNSCNRSIEYRQIIESRFRHIVI